MNAIKTPQAGNVLFILLVGIALFAGLTVAVTQAGKNTGQGKSQKASLIATEIMDYANAVKGAVQKLRFRGCADTDISFENDVVSGYEHTPAAEDRCKVFHPSGGGIKWKTPDPSWMEAAFSSDTFFLPNSSCVKDVGLNGPDASSEVTFCDSTDYAPTDIILFLPGLKEEICQAINEKIANTKNIPIDASHHILPTQFTGTNFWAGREIGDTEGVLTGKYTYCYRGNSAAMNWPNAYTFYSVLWAR